MEPSYTALIQQRDDWWIGWIEEVPGVNAQGRSRDEVLDNLSSALEEGLALNREEALRAAEGGRYEKVRVSPAA